MATYRTAKPKPGGGSMKLVALTADDAEGADRTGCECMSAPGIMRI